MAEAGGQHLGPGARISRYEVREVLGVGGFGITYKAFDTRLHCEVAIKEYLPAEFAVRESDHVTVKPRSQDIAEYFQQGIVRFLDEARVLAKFKNRHIVRVSDYMEVNGTAYLVMDYEEGEPLKALLRKRGGSLSEAEIKDLFIPILDGLKAVHEAGLLHRDIKPDNIYLRNDGPPVLLDFGAARQYTANQTRDITAIVTPGYAPFEQYQPNGQLGAWTDLYAIGATLYHCVSGHAPLDALTRLGTNTDPLPPAVEAGGDRYSRVLLQTIDWMLLRQPDERPRSVDDVIPCVQGRTEPPLSQNVVQPLPSSATATATLRVPPPETAPGGAATILRPPEGTPPADKPSAHVVGRRTAAMIGGVLALLISAGGIWWYADGQNRKQLALDQENTAIVARQEIERKAAEEADRAAKAEAARQTNLAAAQQAEEESRLAQIAADRKATEEAEKQAAEEAAQIARAEADRIAAEEAVQTARLESERKAAEIAAQAARAEAEAAQIAQAVAEAKAQEEAAGVARAEAEQKARDEVARLAQAEAEQKAREEAARVAQIEAGIKKAEEEAALIALLSGQQGSAGASDGTVAAGSADIALSQPAVGADTEPKTITGNVDEFLSALLIEAEQTESSLGAAEPADLPSEGADQPISREQINELLRLAELHLSTSSLVAPADGNALDIYKQILTADPQNQAARTGMISIGAVYEKAAANMLQEGRPDVSTRIVDRGLAAVPDHPGLLELRMQLRAGS